MQQQREFEFTDHHFNVLRSLVNKNTGISLSDAKRDLVYGRISRRLRKLGLTGFDQYCCLLKTNPEVELGNFVNALTTNKTEFFREVHHFHFLNKTAIPELLKSRELDRRIRIWSAGCSTGQEPYSIAMTLMESIPHINNWDIKILATDIDTDVIARAETGIYPEDVIDGVSKERLKRWFKKGKGKKSGMVRASDELKELISFKRLNLMDTWPMRGTFDIIFCRNVVIYFDKPTQRILFNRYADFMKDDGLLFVGHSESLFSVSDRFELLGNTIHKKIM